MFFHADSYSILSVSSNKQHFEVNYWRIMEDY